MHQVIFILDGYDELRPELLWRNLFKTNGLEQYRPASRPRDVDREAKGDAKDEPEGLREGGAEDPEGKAAGEVHAQTEADDTEHEVKIDPLLCYPKVVIFTRSEALAGRAGRYDDSFAPLEARNASNTKHELREAAKYFTELKLLGFDSDQQNRYIHASVALTVRNAVEKRLGRFKPTWRAHDIDMLAEFAVSNSRHAMHLSAAFESATVRGVGNGNLTWSKENMKKQMQEASELAKEASDLGEELSEVAALFVRLRMCASSADLASKCVPDTL